MAVTWTLMRHEDGTPHAVLAVSIDLTERLELEGRLRQAQRLEAVGQLTGGIAHDFNNLLTVILGNSEMLAETLPPEGEAAQMAGMIAAAAARGAELTGRLLAFSRRQALDPKIVDVNLLLGGLGMMLRRTLGAAITLEIRPEERLRLARIDPLQLETAVLNLCINARDAMPQGGRLTIETANLTLEADAEAGLPGGDYIAVTVTDTGMGMAPDVLARAFEPFFTTKEVGAGSGLGLSTVYGFLRQSGGSVTLLSTPGQGTEARLLLPAAPAAAAPAPAAPAAGPLARGRERVLLVEDDELVRAHSAAQLTELGYQVTVAAHAEAALTALAAAEFDLLFTDVVMPGAMNGMQLVEAARRLRPGIRVLLASGFTGHPAPRPAPDVARLPLLKKPYRRHELAERLREVLAPPPDG